MPNLAGSHAPCTSISGKGGTELSAAQERWLGIEIPFDSRQIQRLILFAVARKSGPRSYCQLRSEANPTYVHDHDERLSTGNV